MKRFAPIVVFTYNRLYHIQKTISALRKNEFADQSDLIIFSDGPKTKYDDENVQDVRAFLKTIKGFNSITIHESSVNKGLANSIIAGVTVVVNEHGKVIILEDDILTSKYFLHYMNEALDIYENNDRVISIHGYNYPVRKKLPDTFFLKGADCWGWATWKRGWDLFEPDGVKLLKELERKNLCHVFDFWGTYPYTQMLRDQIDGKNDSWAIRWYASAFLRGKITLYPGKSLVKNIGLDGSGSHCGDTLENQSETFDFNYGENIQYATEITENIDVKRIISRYFFKQGPVQKKRNLLMRLKNKLKSFFSKIYSQEDASNMITFTGDYTSWDDAEIACTGYNSDIILEKCKNSLLKVKNGKAIYERDSVLFDKIEYSWPLLAGLMFVAVSNHGILNVLDFGGSLGSTYYQNRTFLDSLNEVRWNIVEQKSFVECGKMHFENNCIKFYHTIEECLQNNSVNVILLSSVVQYLPDPYRLLDDIILLGVEYIIIDRTAFIVGGRDRLTVQNVPNTIYQASYPAWFLNEEKFLRKFAKNYTLIEKFDSFESWTLDGIRAQDKGFIFRIK